MSNYGVEVTRLHRSKSWFFLGLSLSPHDADGHTLPPFEPLDKTLPALREDPWEPYLPFIERRVKFLPPASQPGEVKYALSSPARSDIIPDRSYVTPDRSYVIPDRSYVIPDQPNVLVNVPRLSQPSPRDVPRLSPPSPPASQRVSQELDASLPGEISLKFFQEMTSLDPLTLWPCHLYVDQTTCGISTEENRRQSLVHAQNYVTHAFPGGIGARSWARFTIGSSLYPDTVHGFNIVSMLLLYPQTLWAGGQQSELEFEIWKKALQRGKSSGDPYFKSNRQFQNFALPRMYKRSEEVKQQNDKRPYSRLIPLPGNTFTAVKKCMRVWGMIELKYAYKVKHVLYIDFSSCHSRFALGMMKSYKYQTPILEAALKGSLWDETVEVLKRKHPDVYLLLGTELAKVFCKKAYYKSLNGGRIDNVNEFLDLPAAKHLKPHQALLEDAIRDLPMAFELQLFQSITKMFKQVRAASTPYPVKSDFRAASRLLVNLEVIMLGVLVETCLFNDVLPISLEHDGISCVYDGDLSIEELEHLFNPVCNKVANELIGVDCPVVVKEYEDLELEDELTSLQEPVLRLETQHTDENEVLLVKENVEPLE
uniref:Uncharacterized protein n=1 Tax=Nephroselmis olivacea TaxID=31312 RepID=Q9T3A0_NEPOL|nr:hypothetical protein NeolCp089 [Nephroselmis olivacea]NP_050953.1 hypothetical protein NeolCp148 [Nephroselmis olivacea]AAD54865.1 unknown [Nephroselmis olivacea]AAD54924.1 unknown [Nephroselmis olivacea]